jgi:hypothetical protein
MMTTASRNVGQAIEAPRVEAVKVEALTTGQMAEVLSKLAGNNLCCRGSWRGEVGGAQ